MVDVLVEPGLYALVCNGGFPSIDGPNSEETDFSDSLTIKIQSFRCWNKGQEIVDKARQNDHPILLQSRIFPGCSLRIYRPAGRTLPSLLSIEAMRQKSIEPILKLLLSSQ